MRKSCRRYWSARRPGPSAREVGRGHWGQAAEDVETKQKAIAYEAGCVKLSPRTVNVYHKTLQQIFGTLADDASLMENPFLDPSRWRALREGALAVLRAVARA